MRSFVRILGGLLVAAALVLVAVPASSGQSSGAAQQIVFGGVGPGNISFFGFWIWCEDEEANNPYASRCAGSMYFYDLGITKGVFGTASESGDSHVMTVRSADGTVACRLWNVPPVTQGPTNTVNATCTAPEGFSGTSTTAVVRVTGPSG